MGSWAGMCFYALLTHCTFAAGGWDSHVTESQLQQVDVNPSSDQQCGSSDCIVELDGQSVKDHPSSNSHMKTNRLQLKLQHLYKQVKLLLSLQK